MKCFELRQYMESGEVSVEVRINAGSTHMETSFIGANWTLSEVRESTTNDFLNNLIGRRCYTGSIYVDEGFLVIFYCVNRILGIRDHPYKY
jgi:hypothetical protein